MLRGWQRERGAGSGAPTVQAAEESRLKAPLLPFERRDSEAAPLSTAMSTIVSTGSSADLLALPPAPSLKSRLSSAMSQSSDPPSSPTWSAAPPPPLPACAWAGIWVCDKKIAGVRALSWEERGFSHPDKAPFAPASPKAELRGAHGEI